MSAAWESFNSGAPEKIPETQERRKELYFRVKLSKVNQKRVLSILLLSLTAVAGVSSLDWQAVDAEIAFTWQYNAALDSTPQGKYPSILLFNIGAAVFADWDGEPGGLYFRPGGWFSWNTEDVYQGVARPCDEAALDHMKVLGLMLDAHFGYQFKIGKVGIGVQGGPSFYLRFPLWTAQEGSAVPADFWQAYYYGGQFLYLGIVSWVAIPVSETMDVLPGLRFYQPLANFWTGAPPAHGIQAALTVSLRFDAFKKAKQRKQANQAE